jgi:hypothetical protein
MSDNSKTYLELLSKYRLDEAWKIRAMGWLCEHTPEEGWMLGGRLLASRAHLNYSYAVNSVFGVDPSTGFLLTLTASGPPTPIASAADWRGGILLTKQNSFDLWRDTREERIQRERLERAGAAAEHLRTDCSSGCNHRGK